jgi:carboxyl-terminal processing protease
MIKHVVYLLIGSFLGLGALTQCSEDPTGFGSEYLDVNSWIRNQMANYYYWNYVIPRMSPGNLPPEVFFEEILYDLDEFSYITDDAETLLEELNGSQYASGFSPALYQITGQNLLVMVVKYVYPDSPADEAGLKRGDIIVSINNQRLSVTNYQELNALQGSVTYGFGRYDYDAETETATITELDTSVTVQKKELQLDPVITTKVIQEGEKSIGYIFYAQFLTGTADIFLNRLTETIQSFKDQQIDELIIDLRYNPGGRIGAASHFANLLVPKDYIDEKSVFVEFEYNTLLENYYQTNEGADSENLFLYFEDASVSLGLDRIYVLTSKQTASASELLIHGLKPYMDVVTVGSNTLGKYYGSFVITGTFQDPPVYYGILPVTLKYLNANEETDFIEGLEATLAAEENLFNAYPLGDPMDPLVGSALTHITGQDIVAKSRWNGVESYKPDYRLIPDRKELRQSSVWFTSTSNLNALRISSLSSESSSPE